MKKLLLKIAVIANAAFLVATFAGCPAHEEPMIYHIAPVPPPRYPTIAPPPVEFIPPSVQDKTNKSQTH